MKRIVFVVNTVMTLMSSVYYAAEIKNRDIDVELALIWHNPTSYNISLKHFKDYFDVVYEVPAGAAEWGIWSLETIKRNTVCREYLRSAGIYCYLKKKYVRDVLMVGADYNGLMGNIIHIYHKKQTSKRIILFEEGMALYSDKKRSFKDVIKYNLGRDVNIQPVVGGSKKVKVIFAQHPKQLPEWKCRNKKIIQQSDVFSNSSIWEKILKHDNYLMQLAEILWGKKVLLYLGQPIHEFSKSFRPQQEKQLLEYLCENMPKNYIILIKAHPRDPASKYAWLQKRDGCVVYDQKAGWYPVECLMNLLNARVVITLSSSAALNILDRFPKCRAIYTYRYFHVEVAGNWDSIYRTYGDRVTFPQLLKDFKAAYVPAMQASKEKSNVRRQECKDLSYLTRYLKGGKGK